MKSFLLSAGLLLTILFDLVALTGLAQTSPINVTTTAVPFLSIAPDARSGGMGDMGVATSPDAYSGMHNAAKTPFADDTTAIGVNYTPWLRDIVRDMYLLSAAGYHKLDENQALTASIRYFGLGNVSVSDYEGNKLSTAHPREYSVDLGYSRKLSERLGLGLTARYIHSDLGSGSVGGVEYKAANAVAADVSVYYDGRGRDGGPGFSGGVVLSNVGSRISYSNDATAKDFLPANLGVGVTYHGVADEDNHWMLGIESNKLLVPVMPSDSAGLVDYHQMGIAKSWGKSFNNSAYKFSVGGEYSYKNEFFIRLGYVAETQQAGDQKYVTAGVGVKYSMMGLDFSYLAPSGNGVTRNPLSNTFRLGLVFGLNGRH